MLVIIIEDRVSCLSWYQEEKSRFELNAEPYVLRKEMIKYCYDDCFILATAFNKFNESMIEELKKIGVKGIIDHEFTIISNFITLPQLVIHWYVGCTMPERSLAVNPNRGYDSGKQGSLKEHLWLCYLDKLNAINEGHEFVSITSRYCADVKQQRFGRYYLDGFRQLPNGARVCYEFYGCYYHGCPICFKDRSKVVWCKHREDGYHTVEKAYMDTLDREHKIKSLMMFNCDKDEWIVMWEHEFNEKEKDIRNFVGDESLRDLVDKLNPHDSVKGGRTEVFRMNCIVHDPSMELIRYLDVNSLHPYVMSITEFPIGHPVIRRGDVVLRCIKSWVLD